MIVSRIFAFFLLWAVFVEGFVQLGTKSSPTTTNDRTSLSRRWNAALEDPEDQETIEEVRLNVLKSRRNQIRWTLRNAEAVKTLRLRQGWVPEVDPETGKPVKSDGKTALTFTAAIIAIGAVVLRVGGRAALVSAVGLDFVTNDPELQQNLQQILDTAENMDFATKAALFTAAWTAVKVLCFDVAGVGLALSAGILFGGVFQGAIASAAAATVGSSIAFGLAKFTPVRAKALEALEEYPSLRGIEKVVAQDGLKAILTLRLAPVLPIPIGMYNYIYGCTNVPFWTFAGGIFIGSLKPYLLDSYLGYFGKEVIDGNASDAAGIQDIILLVALGVSVLIGVFASQLASETWDSVLEEVEFEKNVKQQARQKEGDTEDGASPFLGGLNLPQWVLDFQAKVQQAEIIMQDLVDEEVEARVWNATEANPPLASQDPALRPTSLEFSQARKGIDYVLGFCESLVLSPLLFSTFFKYADPLYSQDQDDGWQERQGRRTISIVSEVGQLEQSLTRRMDQIRDTAIQKLQRLDERSTSQVDGISES